MIRRCSLLDLPEILDVIGPNIEDVILMAKIRHGNYYYVFLNDTDTCVYIFEFVSGDICMIHTYSKKEGRGKEFIRGALEAEEWMRTNTPMRIGLAIAEGMDNDLQVRILMNHLGMEKIHTLTDQRSFYIKR